MPIADCRLPNGKWMGLRPSKARARAPAAFPLPYMNKHSAFGNRHSAFTLIELLVAVGLTAILLTMIAVIFYEASQAFGAARASIEIHESARSALNALLNDLTAASFTPYDTGVQGYFALSQGPTDPATGATGASDACGLNWLGAWSSSTSYAVNDGVSYGGSSYICIAANPSASQPPPNPKYWNPLVADTLTFTTLAPQPGARYAATEAVEQLALVRYALEWDGGNATLPGSSTPRPTYNLVKRVRFPCTGDPNLNMDIFNWNLINPATSPPLTYLQSEYTFNSSDALDIAGLRYAQSEVIAFHVLSMNVRLFCLPAKYTTETSEAFVEAGIASSGTSTTLTDNGISGYYPEKTWPIAGGTFSNLRIYAGAGAGQPVSPTLLPITASGSTLTVSNSNTMSPSPGSGSQYRVEGNLAALTTGPMTPSWPGWYQRGSYDFFGPTYRPPAIVEVTLEMTDARATHSFFFTQRFYVPASER
jgi:type II secretory pathway pseudopilin PulG